MQTSQKTYKYCITADLAEGMGWVHAGGVPDGIPFSAPAEFQGRPGVWTPEHFLLSAVTGCFATTFSAIAKLSNFKFCNMTLTAEGDVQQVPTGWQFTRIILRPKLLLFAESDRDRGLRLVQKAEQACIVSKSLLLKVELEPFLEVVLPTVVH